MERRQVDIYPYYEQELRHLREMGQEFAQAFPKVAARLGMSGLDVEDPYVERLLEGVAFLAARVQLKLDAEFPRFTQALLEILYPHFLAPTPSMLVAALRPDPAEPTLARGFTVRRGTAMHSVVRDEETTSCEFRTAQDVTLWPVEIASASYFTFAPDLPLTSLPMAARIRGGLRIRLRTTAGLKFKQTSIDRLPFYLTGHDDVALKLYEWCLGAGLGVLVMSRTGDTVRHEFLPASAIGPVGFADDEALLPVTLRSFQGYRLLQEYFAFPARYRFIDVRGLSSAVGRADTSDLEIVVLLGQGDPTFDRVVDASNFALFCTPAINLFERRAERIHVTDGSHEYHVVADRTRPLDFEVYAVTGVVGYGVGADSEQEFRPFYSAFDADAERPHTTYFTTRREPWLDSSTVKRRGPRSSYVKLSTEVFLSLVDSAQAPYDSDLRQVSIDTLCTNRDLVLLMPVGAGKSDLGLDVAAPVTSIRIVNGPSRPYAPLAEGSIAWRAISHLSLNYLSLVDTDDQHGASALRDLLDLYAAQDDATARRQITGIHAVAVQRVVRRIHGAGPLAFGRGLEITVSVDELAFAGASAFLLGSVLERYFARHVSINAFTETVLRSDSRGEIHRWVPQWGARPTL